MTEMAPAVALLFDDTELVGQLREALQERGARIVHEGGVSSLSRELLQRVGVDVLVVNLDDSADDALDRLYEVIDAEYPRVVFNDAQASRALDGWDRARWARHLAVKVLAAGDIDPPRPDDAHLVVTSSTAVAAEPVDAVPMVDESALSTSEAAVPDLAPEAAAVETVFVADEIAAPAAYSQDFAPGNEVVEHEQSIAEESESLEAELEALLASGELPEDDDVPSGPGLRFVGDAEPPPLYDGNFGVPPPAALDTDAAAELSMVESVPTSPSRASPPEFQIDHLELSSLTDQDVTTISASAAHPLIPESAAPVRAPEGWALVDDDAAPADTAPIDKPSPAMFGIEKISAADFLAHDIEAVAPDLEPVMSLELVSMEEAIAPQAYVHDHEMVLDELGSALSRVVLLGAATEGVDAVSAFLAALPGSTRLTFLHTQHVGTQSDAALVEKFQAHCALPVRLAEHEGRAGHGEVLMVPAGQQVRLRRDGRIELQANADQAAESSSIDASLTMAANVFGRDALAIVFGGSGNDAVAGAQAVHDRGGQVWVESSTGEYSADMVSGIFAERLVSFSGTPTELAARLIEVFP